MKQKKVQKLKHGLYEIYWKSGGHSLASVGSLEDGTRWFAPSNWTYVNTTAIACKDWTIVRNVKLIISSQ